MRLISSLLPLLLCAAVRAGAQESRAPRVGALNAIVGEWQSDTADSTSVRSTCRWSPQGRAVICEQTITTGDTISHTLNAYMVDSSAGRYVYYGIFQPGMVVHPVPLEIHDHIWIYGGDRLAGDSLYYRTINDFTAHSVYTWRQESSRDGVHWTTERQGRVVRRR